MDSIPYKHNIRFKVSFDNGETFYEGKGMLAERKGDKSPAQRLFDYQDRHGLEITSLSLYSKGGQEWHLPSSGKNPKFKAFETADKPVDYNIFRKVGRDLIVTGKVIRQGNVDHFTCVEAIFDSYKLQLWVNENPPHNSYTMLTRE